MITRKFGVEIETSSCPEWEDYDSCGAWDAKMDYSVSGMEFASTVLSGYSGFAAIRDICEYAACNDWRVDDDCGLHVHFDMCEENDDSLKAIALAYKLSYEVWIEFVDSNRVDNRYCGEEKTDISDLYGARDFDRFSNNLNRYTWINFNAYNRHGTYEVRLHHGSLDACAICNWVKAHAVFIDWASEAGWAGVRNTLLCMDKSEKADFIAQLWCRAGYEDIADYYSKLVCA